MKVGKVVSVILACGGRTSHASFSTTKVVTCEHGVGPSYFVTYHRIRGTHDPLPLGQPPTMPLPCATSTVPLLLLLWPPPLTSVSDSLRARPLAPPCWQLPPPSSFYIRRRGIPQPPSNPNSGCRRPPPSHRTPRPTPCSASGILHGCRPPPPVRLCL
jgi:hypothetical protein